MDPHFSPTTMSTQPSLAGLPNEIVVKILEHAGNTNELAFVNKQFAACVQEARLRDLDLTARPQEQPYELIRTLLDKPNLGLKTQSLKLAFPHQSNNSRVSKDIGNMILIVTQQIVKMGLSKENTYSWVRMIESLEDEGWLFFLITIATNLKHLDLDLYSTLSAFDHFSFWTTSKS
ncbi:hypothetical protein BDV95DRAFT_587327 [Massariosphaeria phaeospora]|uniref:F-box domain-containing protein n=1 Tax=Massariosphaeria phaeospora TaxID=100035 RepID=A0A7C8HYM3_9PLEO|nr:hypothetical protein BDV95DRAFT_587327 [Massariosphaeria phaeospora]